MKLECAAFFWVCMCLKVHVAYILLSVLDLAEEVWETYPTCYIAQKNEFMEISSKSGSQKAPELPLDLTLIIIHVHCYE